MPGCEVNAVFSRRLNELLREKEATQKEVAKFCGVSTSAVSNWAVGINFPRYGRLKRLSEFFGVSVPYFLGEDK